MLHDPEISAAGRMAGVAARLAVMPVVQLAELVDIPRTMEVVAQQVLTGDVTVSQARAVAALAQVSVSCHVAMDQLAERAKVRRGGMNTEQLRELITRARAKAMELEAMKEKP